MSNNTLNPANLKCGPFLHKGGWIAVNSPKYTPSGFTGTVRKHKLNLKAGWHYNVMDKTGVILTYDVAPLPPITLPNGNPYGENPAPNPRNNETTAKREYEAACRKVKWQKLWQAAIDNMPKDHMLKIKALRWVKRPRGSTPIPDFAIGNAHGTMKIMDGHVYEQVEQVYEKPAAQQALCARICGYTYTNKVTGKTEVNSMTFRNVIGSGMRPRDVEKQKLVLRLASKEGKELARKLAAQLIP